MKKKIGKKTKLGFYRYDKKSQTINYDLYKKNSIVIKHRISDQDETEIIDRLILIMLNEAARCIEEYVVESAEQSNRISVPEISKLEKLKNFISCFPQKGCLFFCDIKFLF